MQARTLHNEDIPNVYSSHHWFRIIKIRNMRGGGGPGVCRGWLELRNFFICGICCRVFASKTMKNNTKLKFG
jgi:hypothetical protein